MAVQISIKRGVDVLSRETLDNPEEGDVTGSITRQIGEVRKREGAFPREFTVDVRVYEPDA